MSFSPREESADVGETREHRDLFHLDTVSDKEEAILGGKTASMSQGSTYKTPLWSVEERWGGRRSVRDIERARDKENERERWRESQPQTSCLCASEDDCCVMMLLL